MRPAMANLDFQTTRNGTVAVIARRASSTSRAPCCSRTKLDRLASESELSAVVLDLRQLEFMDSSGLRLVVLADMRAREAGRRFVLVKGADTVHRVFEITRMSERLEFVADPEELQ